LDKQKILELTDDIKRVITAEESNVIGGLGGAVCEALDAQLDRKIVRLGINDEFGQSASCYEDLIQYYNLTPENIVNHAKKLML